MRIFKPLFFVLVLAGSANAAYYFPKTNPHKHKTTVDGGLLDNLPVVGTNDRFVIVASTATGAGSAALGANSPAATPTAPAWWVTVNVCNSDGTGCQTGYIPVWK